CLLILLLPPLLTHVHTTSLHDALPISCAKKLNIYGTNNSIDIPVVTCVISSFLETIEDNNPVSNMYKIIEVNVNIIMKNIYSLLILDILLILIRLKYFFSILSFIIIINFDYINILNIIRYIISNIFPITCFLAGTTSKMPSNRC